MLHGTRCPLDVPLGYDEPAMDDAELVRSAREGDKEAFAQIYDRYSGNIFAFLVTVTRNREEAADALQDTFLAAATRLHQLREPSKLRAWLFAIARHNAMHGLARTSRHEALEAVEVVDRGPDPSEVAASTELAGLIRQAADGLGEQERIVLGLHLEQGLQGHELGDALGVSASHAYVLMNRMRQQVERALGALLVARQGREECDKLHKVLESWDGKFSVLWRKRVARHVDGCEVCGALRKRLVSPISMMAVPPFIPAPAEARAALLRQLELIGFRSEASGPVPEQAAGADTFRTENMYVGREPTERQHVGTRKGPGVAGQPWPKRYGGFPPPMVRPRRRGVGMAIAAALALLLFSGPVGGLENGFEPLEATAQLVFPDGLTLASPSPSPAAEASEELTPAPGATAAASPGRLRPSVAPVGPEGEPPARPGPDADGVDDSAGNRTGTTGDAGSGGTTTETQEDPDPVDGEPPSLTVRVRPAQVYATRCASRGDPTQATVTAQAADDGGLASMRLSYAGTSKSMSGSGGTYAATLGPFESEGTVPFTVVATDQQGNSTTRKGSVRVICDHVPPPPAPPPALRAPEEGTGVVPPSQLTRTSEPTPVR